MLSSLRNIIEKDFDVFVTGVLDEYLYIVPPFCSATFHLGPYLQLATSEV